MASNSLFPGLFSRSPLTSLQSHIETVSRCVAGLRPFFEGVDSDDWEKADAAADQISVLENRADQLKKEIRLNLPRSIFTPFARSDLLELLAVQDQIANRARDIAGLMRGRRLSFPAELNELVESYVSHSVIAVNMAEKGMNSLNKVVGMGFAGPQIELLENILEELDKAESDSDDCQVTLRGRLYLVEGEMNPVDVMFLYQIVDYIGEIADLSERVGHRILYLIAR